MYQFICFATRFGLQWFWRVLLQSKNDQQLELLIDCRFIVLSPVTRVCNLSAVWNVNHLVSLSVMFSQSVLLMWFVRTKQWHIYLSFWLRSEFWTQQLSFHGVFHIFVCISQGNIGTYDVSCCNEWSCLVQRLKLDLMEGFERQLQELIDDFVQEVEDIEQVPSCNGPNKSVKLVSFPQWCN